MQKYSKGIGGAVSGLIVALLVQYLPEMPMGTIEAIGAAVGGILTFVAPANK